MSQFTKRSIAPYRVDIVGSFLRPQELKKAREAFRKGEIGQDALRDVEDRLIEELIQKEVKAGLQSVTDGEFRRSWWHLDFFWGLNGVKKVVNDNIKRHFKGIETRPETAVVVDRVSGENHPFVEHFKFLRAHTPEGIEARQSIPAPAQFLYNNLANENILRETKKVYDRLEDLSDDLAKAYGQVFHDLQEAGARTIQLDDVSWAGLVGEVDETLSEEEKKAVLQQREEWKKLFLRANNDAIAHAPEGLNITTHVCRGNYRSHWYTSGSYEAVAHPLFDQENVAAYYLEYDSDRAGGFESLAKVPKEKLVVLGLVTSKSPELEDPKELIARIHEAGTYVDLDRLAISPQCGFASTEEGNELTEEDQWKKIALLQEVAKEVWGC